MNAPTVASLAKKLIVQLIVKKAMKAKTDYINEVRSNLIMAIGSCKFTNAEILKQYNKRLAVHDAVSYFIMRS